jgi:hypothetical protein
MLSCRLLKCAVSAAHIGLKMRQTENYTQGAVVPPDKRNLTLIWRERERERESERRTCSQVTDCLGAEDKWMLNTISTPVSSFNCAPLYVWVDGGPCE